jgi:hypothetical protein
MELYATLCARIAEGDRSLSTIAADAGTTEKTFRAAETHWTQQLAVDTFAGGTLARRFSEAFVAAQDAIRPAPRLSIERYAEALARVDAEGATRVLADLRLTQPDWLREKRHWTRTMGKDRALAHVYAKTFHAATERHRAESER